MFWVTIVECVKSQLRAYVPLKCAFGERSVVEPEKYVFGGDKLDWCWRLNCIVPELSPAVTLLPTLSTVRPRPFTSYSTRVLASILADGVTRAVSATGERVTGVLAVFELE